MTMTEGRPSGSGKGNGSVASPNGATAKTRPKAHRPFRWVIRGILLAVVGYLAGALTTSLWLTPKLSLPSRA